MYRLIIFYLLFVTVPWICVGEGHLFVLNFATERVELLGWQKELNLSTLVMIAITLVLFLVAVVATMLSRSYCGEWCPTTFFGRIYRVLFVQQGWVRVVVGVGVMVIAHVMFALSFVAYGVGAEVIVQEVIDRNVSTSVVMVIFLSCLLLAQTVMLKGWYCKNLCPYQAATFALHAKRYYRLGGVIVVVGIGVIAYLLWGDHLSYCLIENKELYFP
jgi:polyferredoxin